MKKTIGAIILAVIFIGCVTTSRTNYNTLSAVMVTTDSATKAYLDMVIQGKVSTNGVPFVLRTWDKFRVAWKGAVSLAAMGTNAPASETVLTASSNVLFTIQQVRSQ
jgi:hypothetical protein